MYCSVVYVHVQLHGTNVQNHDVPVLQRDLNERFVCTLSEQAADYVVRDPCSSPCAAPAAGKHVPTCPLFHRVL